MSAWRSRFSRAARLLETAGLLISRTGRSAHPTPCATGFASADLYAEDGIPAFGWQINAERGSENNTPGPPNLFGAAGSFNCFTCAQVGFPTWLPTKVKLSKVGIIAYNVPQSTDCALGNKASFEKYETADVVFDDESISYGNADWSPQVSQMVDEGVDFVIACIDFNGIINRNDPFHFSFRVHDR